MVIGFNTIERFPVYVKSDTSFNYSHKMNGRNSAHRHLRMNLSLTAQARCALTVAVPNYIPSRVLILLGSFNSPPTQAFSRVSLFIWANVFDSLSAPLCNFNSLPQISRELLPFRTLFHNEDTLLLFSNYQITALHSSKIICSCIALITARWIRSVRPVRQWPSPTSPPHCSHPHNNVVWPSHRHFGITVYRYAKNRNSVPS